MTASNSNTSLGEMTIFELSKLEELRFEVSASGSMTLELMDGLAEMFGTELILMKKYTFPAGSKGAAFTFHGATIKLIGQTEVAYKSSHTPMVMYSNVHAALEQLRNQAKDREFPRGPRVMIAGPTDVGKSTLCKMLINYAVRSEWIPTLVDLDVGQGEITIPGTLSAAIITRTHDIEEGFPQSQPLIYHFGYKSPEDNVILYNQLVSSLSQSVNMRCEKKPIAATSGVVINTSGWISGGGFKSLVHIAGAFEVDVVIVLDQERLFVELKREMPEFVKIIHLPKSGGVVSRSTKQRRDTRDVRVKNYFYGTKGNLSPHCFYINFTDVKIFKIGAPEMSDSLLPLGMILQQGQTKIIQMIPSPSLKHHVLSVCSCEEGSDEETIVNSPVIGFILITDVDMERGRLMILAPAPAPLPKTTLLYTEITFLDGR